MKERDAQRQLHKDLFISVLALVSVGIGVYDLARPRTSAALTWLDILDLAIVAVFIIDFIVSAVRSGKASDYVKRHWYEIPAMIPLTGNMVAGAEFVPFLRALRLVRFVRVLRLLRVVGALARLRSFWTRALRIARRAHVVRLAVFAIAMVFVGAASGWLAESRVNERFASFGESAWWALNMFTNVAYVDFQPATSAGRLVAGVLEFTGIAFIGLFTASLANAFNKEDDEEAKKGHAKDEKKEAPLD
jgi:voltage-gated potassium channel